MTGTWAMVIEWDWRFTCWSWSEIVIGTAPNPWFGYGSGLETNWIRWNRFHPIKKPNRNEPTVLWLVPQSRKPRTFAPVKYLSSDRLTIWYIHNRCSFACSFTTSPRSCDLINIRWVTSKNAHILALYHCDSNNIDLIANWRIGGEWVCKRASFTYILYCDTIRTRILNQSQRSEFAKMRLCWM